MRFSPLHTSGALATNIDCQYAWGEADAAQVWGEAYFANHEPALAHRAFTQALAVRKRIEHPGVAETEKWLEYEAAQDHGREWSSVARKTPVQPAGR